MPLIVIKGTFHLVGANKAGKPTGVESDGDSMQFKLANPGLLDRLERLDQPYRLTAIGSTRLRFEGVEALEPHFESTRQPRPLGTGELGLNPVPCAPPRSPTVPGDAPPGFILARALEIY